MKILFLQIRFYIIGIFFSSNPAPGMLPCLRICQVGPLSGLYIEFLVSFIFLVLWSYLICEADIFPGGGDPKARTRGT